MGLELIPVSPAALAAGNNNDYAGVGASSFARLSANAAGSTLTGIVAPAETGNGDRLLLICNISANTLTINNADGNSAAANQFQTAGGGNLTLNQNQCVWFIYDTTTAKWRQVTAVL